MKRALFQAAGILTLLMLVGDLIAAVALLLSTPAASADPGAAPPLRTASGKLPVLPATASSSPAPARPIPAEPSMAANARPTATEMPARRHHPSRMTRKSMITHAGR